MKRYPEWFIGGPLHGEDKALTFPNVPEWSMVRAYEHWTMSDLDENPELDPSIIGNIKTEWYYYPDVFTLGSVMVKFWTDRRNLSHEIIASQLGELIMAPHSKEEVPQ